MTDWIIRILGGAPLEHSGKILRMNLGLGDGLSRGWFIGLAIAVVPLTILSYRRTRTMTSLPRRITLSVLRVVFFLLILAFLARPMLELIVQGSVRRTLIVMVDSSQSMGIQDNRATDVDRQRAATALGQSSGSLSPTARPSRLDLTKAVLNTTRGGLIKELSDDFNLAGYTFSDTVSPMTIPTAQPTTAPAGMTYADLKPTGGSTAIGEAVELVLREKRGQPLAGVLLISDFGNNSGVAPTEAAQLAADQNVPLFTWGVGISNPRDIAVTNVFVERYAFSNNELPVAVRIRTSGMIGETVPLTVTMGDQTVINQEVTFDHDGETVINAHFNPQSPGDFQLTARIPPLDEETIKDNNTATSPLRIIDGKIKVLYIDSAPRWDFKYLQAMLLRDPRISAKFVLLEGDPAIGNVEGSPYLAAIPETREELFKYDMIIVGDVSPQALPAAQQSMLDEFVSKLGGAVIFLAGQNHNPADFANQPLGKLLPVIPAPPPESPDLSSPIQLQLTSAGKANAMLALADDENENARRWSTLPPIYWTAPVAKLKLGAQALLVDVNSNKGNGSSTPVMVSQTYGLGQVLFLGTDETWRWRKNQLIPLHDALWSQIIQHMGLTHLLGLSQKVQLTSDKDKYTVGDHVTVYARVYGDNFEPLNAPSVEGTCAGEKSAPIPVSLPAVPNQPGLYKGTFVATTAGNYTFSLANFAVSKLTFDVEAPTRETGDPAMNESLMREMATLSGGKAFREEDLSGLVDTIRSGTAQVQTPMTVDLAMSPLMYGLILATGSAEWILRKLSRLK